MEKDSPAANPAIEEVRQRLDSWRKTKKNHREPIPAYLWQTAADLARAHSVNSVSKALRLSYTDLKEHAYGRTNPKKRKRPSFVEISPGPVLSREATLEMENPKGSKIRISFKGKTDFDFTAFAKTFMQKVR